VPDEEALPDGGGVAGGVVDTAGDAAGLEVSLAGAFASLAGPEDPSFAFSAGGFILSE